MTDKQNGLGWRYFVAGVDLSGDTGAINNAATSIGVQEAPGIANKAQERIALTRDGRIEWSTWWNPPGAHVTLSQLPTADRPVMMAVGTDIGDPAACIVAKQIGYNPTRDDNGAISGIDVQALANGFGLEWGHLLTPGIAQVDEAGAQAGLDLGATTAFGLQAYLHTFAFAGTDATVTLQHSDDDGDADAYANVADAAFAEITSAPGSQRLQTDRDASIKRWLRVNVTTTGGFTSMHFAVAAVKNLTEVLF